MKNTYYIASWLQGEGEGINKVEYDPSTNTLYSKEIISSVKRSSYFARNKDILYVLTEMPMAIPNKGVITSFKISDEGLLALNQSEYFDSGVTHLSISNNKKHLYGSGYGTGTVIIADTDEQGNISNTRKGYKNIGSSINLKRQESSHLHFSIETPDNGYLCVSDLGTDEILFFKIEENTGNIIKVSSSKTPLGYGPRHMIFSKDSKYLYVLCELNYHLLIYSYNGCGDIEFLEDVDLWKELPEDKRACSAIKLSKDGKYLFTANRGEGYNSIDCFDLSDPTKPIKECSYLETGFPRDFTLLEDGLIAICNQHENNITFIKHKNKSLTKTGIIENIQMPVSIIQK